MRTLSPIPAVLVARVKVCVGDSCTIERARGTASNARRDLQTMINNLKIHAFYLYADRTNLVNDINQIKYDKMLKIRDRKNVSINVIDWELKYIGEEKFSVKRVNIRGRYWVQARNIETGKITANERWENVDKNFDINQSISQDSENRETQTGVDDFA